MALCSSAAGRSAGVALFFLAHLQMSSAQARVEEAGFVRINGIEQWITIRGNDARSPILLIVHGGPADPASPLVKTFAPYESRFVVAQWDQRGAGRTFERNKNVVKGLTLDEMVTDGLEVAQYLRSNLRNTRLIVLGHSWGSMLATEMVQRKPDLFAAYVGTGQVTNWTASVQEQWKALKTAAQAANDQHTLDLIDSIGEPDPMNITQFVSWRSILNQKYLGPADSAWLRKLRTESLGLTPEDRKSSGEAGNFSGARLFKYYSTEDLPRTAKNIPVPFFVIQGRDDLFTPTDLARQYFDEVKAPKKRWIVIEGAGHFALFTHQEQFLSALVSLGKPVSK
jgi:pimeloyl-ACP methyl ester carboxylesterase